MKQTEWHLDVYADRSELYEGEEVTIFQEGPQDSETVERYLKIQKELENGFLEDIYERASNPDYDFKLPEEQKIILQKLVDGVTSEVGRAIVGLTYLQLTVKSISPNQSIRLHKGGNSSTRFSWKEGISMRTLDSSFNAPFLRKYNLLKINKDGIMMTRSLAENYPYSRIYKAEIRGPVEYWLDIMEGIEYKSIVPVDALCYLTILLKNRSDQFAILASRAIDLLQNYADVSFNKICELIVSFYSNTSYSARAFEIVLHSFVQALVEFDMIDGTLEPLSQMRSANKKHKNVGDIEIKAYGRIVESWDAKYGKRDLRDELEELNDKLDSYPGIEIVGFIGDLDFKQDGDLSSRIEEISVIHNVKVLLFSFNDWIKSKIMEVPKEKTNSLGRAWLTALVETCAQRRRNIAPIDEPCDIWLRDLINIMNSDCKGKIKY